MKTQHKKPKTWRYEWIAIRFETVLNLLEMRPDAYVSDDVQGQQWRRVKAEGFKWIRTDGDFAIFEKVTVIVEDQPCEGSSDTSG